MRFSVSASLKTGDAMIVHLIRNILKITKQKVYGILAKHSHGHWFQVWIAADGKIGGWSKQVYIKLRSRLSNLWLLLRSPVFIGQFSGTAAWLRHNFSKVSKRQWVSISITFIIVSVIGVQVSSHIGNENPATDNTKSLLYDSLATRILDTNYDVLPEVSEIEQSQATAVTSSTETANRSTSSVPVDYHERVRVLGNFDEYEHVKAYASAQEVVVAIVDSGIDGRQNDLDGVVVGGADFANSGTLQDIYHHGTHVAKIIASGGSGGSEAGLAPWCRLLNVKVADDLGRCTAAAAAKGIVWAADNGANVINLSLEIRKPSPVLEEAANYAWNRGLVLVAAAGNDSGESPVYPAYYEPCIAVAEIGQDGNLAPLSNHGDWVDLAALAGDSKSVLSDIKNCKVGTSFSCAYVSRVAALLFSVVSDLNGNGRVNDEVRDMIMKTCREVLLPS